MESEYIHDWVFNYNCITKEWHATTRDGYNDLFSNVKNVVRNRSLNRITAAIEYCKGDFQETMKLVNK